MSDRVQAYMMQFRDEAPVETARAAVKAALEAAGVAQRDHDAATAEHKAAAAAHDAAVAGDGDASPHETADALEASRRRLEVTAAVVIARQRACDKTAGEGMRMAERAAWAPVWSAAIRGRMEALRKADAARAALAEAHDEFLAATQALAGAVNNGHPGIEMTNKGIHPAGWGVPPHTAWTADQEQRVLANQNIAVPA